MAMNSKLKWSLNSLVGIVIIGYIISVYWSIEPDSFTISGQPVGQQEKITGYATTQTLIDVVTTLLEKRGGFLSNDVMPPSLIMDNMPAWEFGALVQSRDLVRTLRKEMSRSQSQSVEQDDLKKAEPQLHIDHTNWIFPSAEGEYEQAIKALQSYQQKLSSSSNDAQFYARADNLREWLKDVEKRLGSLAQRLGASVGEERVNTDLAGDDAATQSTSAPSHLRVKTPWLEIDDVFYEARGACWALLHFLKAVEIDFAEVLEKKNATASLQQIIRELEATQETVWSPMVLNGGGFGIVANHSLVMASYVSRANAAIIDLRDLLARG